MRYLPVVIVFLLGAWFGQPVKNFLKGLAAKAQVMVLLVILLGAAGYALLYAGLKGDAASIHGVPLWRKPWLPFVAAITAKGAPAKVA